MSYCGKCGAWLEEGTRFCKACGASQEQGAQQFDAWDVENNKAMGILAYLGILVLIPLVAAKDSKFARFHVNQGLVLFIAEFVYGVVYGVMRAIFLGISLRLYFISSVIGIFGVFFLVLSIFGIVNVVNGQAKELPVIGKYKIIK